MSLFKSHSNNENSRSDHYSSDCRSNNFRRNDFRSNGFRSNDFRNNDYQCKDSYSNYYGGDHLHANSSKCHRINDDYRMEDNPSNRYCSNNYHGYGHRNNICRDNDMGNGEYRSKEYRSNQLSRSGSANQHDNQGRSQPSSSENDNYFGDGHGAVNPAPAIFRNASSAVKPKLESYYKTLREGGWNGMLHFMASHGLDMYKYREGKTILDAYIDRDQQAWEQGDKQERQDQGNGQTFDFDDGEVSRLHLTRKEVQGQNRARAWNDEEARSRIELLTRIHLTKRRGLEQEQEWHEY